MGSATILVVDDEPDIRESVKDILEDEGYEVVLAENAAAAREARRARRPDAILLDVWMPDEDGVSLLREWSSRGGLPCPVVMMSGHGTIETAVEATRHGAWDFVEKPISLAKLLLTLKRALEAGRLRDENAALRAQVAATAIEPVGSGRAMSALKGQLERVAIAEAPVLIQGEPGTGRETIARHLHARGPRRDGPFVRVSVSALPPQNAAALLFGAERDGEVSYGFLDQAQRGFLYVEGVTDLDPESQRRLAIALETGSYTREGGAQPIPLDLRVVAATSIDLEPEVRAGRFRQDLYFQLSVLPLVVPPLRERLDDLPELVDHFAEFFATRDQLPYRRFTLAAKNRLRQHGWPGNLRELRNLVQRLLILGHGGDVEAPEVERVLGSALAPPRATRPAGEGAFEIDYGKPLREARDDFERAYLSHLLRQADGSVGKLAQLSGMERTHLYRKLRDLGIEIRGRE
jgi:DNA-binding NtrC family response regulator